METVLCNNNWMAVSFHLGSSLSLNVKVAKEKEKRRYPGWRNGGG